MKSKFTDLLNYYQDDTIDIKEKNIADSKRVLKLTGVTAKKHITMTKRALSWSIGIAVAMMSCITVYAVENGAIANLKSYFNHSEVPYSYSGTYNQIDEDYIYNNISTDFTIEVISDGSNDTHIEINGYVADDYNMYIMGNVVFDNNDLGSISGFKNIYAVDFEDPYYSVDNQLFEDSKFYNLIEKDVSIYVPLDELDTINLEEEYPIEEINAFLNVYPDENDNLIILRDDYKQYVVNADGTKTKWTSRKYVQNLGSLYVPEDTDVTDNKIPIIYIVNSETVTMSDVKSIDVSVGKLTTNPNGSYYNQNVSGVDIDETVRVTFDRDAMEKNIETMTNTIGNLNVEGDRFIIDSITYSPLSFVLTFKDTIDTNDCDWLNPPYFQCDNRYTKPNVYLIYSDGTRVYQNYHEIDADFKPIYNGYSDKYVQQDDNYCYDIESGEAIGVMMTLAQVTSGLEYVYVQPVDYTNVVSIEINGTVIPLQN